MSEEIKMSEQENLPIDVITSYNDVPYFMIENDLLELGQEDYYKESKEIIDLYNKYKQGMEFITEGSNGNYVPSEVKFKKSATIINKEARFLFANSPDISVNVDDVDGSLKEQNTIIQDYLNAVLKANNFNSQLIKAVKDCFVAKRIAIILNFNEETGVSLTFLNSLEFLYKQSKANSNELSKFICFHNTTTTANKSEQVWFKKTYELINQKVYVSECYFDGLGNILEGEGYPQIDKQETKFEFIPAIVILNDGLIGDTKGQSELKELLNYEAVYSKLANADVDTERKSMNPIIYAIDASEQSTRNLSTAPGAFWDIQTDVDKEDNAPQANIGLIESSMNYSAALKVTLDRIENEMYAEVDVPNINSEQLTGVITSGKTLSALYWGLTVRCDEKMLAWGPAFEYIAKAIIEGGKLYPNCIGKYTEESIPDIEYEILVENNYPLPEDLQEEKQQDITEVDAMLMSKKAYIKKWRGLSDKDTEEELKQIKAEQDLFDNSSSSMNSMFGGIEDEEYGFEDEELDEETEDDFFIR